MKETIFKISGESVFRKLRYESGVHRVQRVPATEAQGRIHTSTATVAVLPEAEEVDFELKPEDLRIEVCRAGGPGGQGVNTTDSAVQVMYIPTGRIVRCQDGRSQQKNKEKALSILRARLLEEKAARGRSEIFRHPQKPDRLRRARGKDPHLQFPAEPDHRSPHRPHALQSRSRHGRRPERNDLRPPARRSRAAAQGIGVGLTNGALDFVSRRRRRPANPGSMAQSFPEMAGGPSTLARRG